MSLSRSVSVCILLAACDYGPELHRVDCADPCYSGPAYSRSVGACKDGEPVCDVNDVFVECRGEITPTLELCNGADDDCDGVVDERPADELLGKSCGPPIGRCNQGEYACNGGKIICTEVGEPMAESCNGVDDDCDGEVDNIATISCYDGPEDSLGHGGCRAGTIACASNGPVCVNQLLPDQEACNGIDDDCDGNIDEEVSNPPDASIDVVLLVDRSGSMRVRRHRVVLALEAMAHWFTDDPRYRFAVVSVPGRRADSAATVDLDFMTAGEIRPLFYDLIHDQGAYESTYDALVDVATGELNLSWRDGSARIQILFTDDYGQSYRSDPLQELDVAGILGTRGHRFYGFVRPIFHQSFNEIASLTGGEIFDLEDLDLMFGDLLFALERCVMPQISGVGGQ